MRMAYQKLRPRAPRPPVSVIVVLLITIYTLGTTTLAESHCPASSSRTKTTTDQRKTPNYSLQNVPKFCSSLKSPTGEELPVLSPSLIGFELNKLGKAGLLAQNDPRMLDYLWDHCDIFLRPPTGQKCTYKGPSPSMGQDEIVRKLLGPEVVKNGFYIECGACDGVRSSNSLIFEKKYGWTGLLLEPDPSNLRKLYGTGRNAWISHSCLSLTPYPQEMPFQPGYFIGRIVDPNFPVAAPAAPSRKYKKVWGAEGQKQINVQCFPLYSYLAALNVSTVDYFSLDIEGHELAVLKTIPFDKVHIKVLSVEFLLSPGGENPIREFMESKGYITAHRFLHRRIPFDLIFVHKSVNVPQSVLEKLAVGL